MIKFLIKAYNNSDWFHKDFAVVEIPERLLEKIEEAKNYIYYAPESIKSGVCVKIYGVSVEFFNSSYLDDLDEVEGDLIIIEEWVTSNPTFQQINIDTDNLAFLLGEVERFDGMHAIVDSCGLTFYAYSKWGEGEEMFTDSITFEELAGMDSKNNK